jgi:hypothetical protein
LIPGIVNGDLLIDGDGIEVRPDAGVGCLRGSDGHHGAAPACALIAPSTVRTVAVYVLASSLESVKARWPVADVNRPSLEP